jgi:hypothetical protein
MRVSIAIAALALSLSAVACGASAGGLPERDPDIVGVVTSVDPFQPITEDCVEPDSTDPDHPVSSDDLPFCTGEDEDTLGHVLVEEVPGQEAGDNKIVFRVGQGTTIRHETAERQQPAGFSDLVEGTRVEAWAAGAIAESYPAQADGAAIVILGMG